MPKPKVLALVMAGGEGSRLELLTERRAKPALPFAGVYRLIDFPLSNCVHSGIEDVWVLQQYRVQSLNDQLANGRPWDLDRTYGGLRLLPPQLGAGDGDGFHEGNADAIWRNRQLIAEHDPEVVLVLSADHVYRLDYGQVLARHRDRGAGVTVVTSEVPNEREAARQAVVEVAHDGRISGFHYKPDKPPTTRVATEVLAFQPGRLLDTLDELAAGDGELKDFGHGLLPRLVEAGEAVEHRMAGYWRDVGTVPAYWQAHMDLLDPERPLDLDDPAWPVLGRAPHRLPARVEGSARLEQALLSPGAVVCGEVARSVLGPGVVVEPGATVRDAVLLEACVVAAGATVERAVLDRDVRVGPRAVVGGQGGDRPALVGEAARIPEDSHIPPGGRFGADGPEEATA
ncbi:MAG TPA: glucose-1-phosphate adenylyltransferase family protein [Actinomycetota bacterium]|nr:glucose-1-phosphate adenylyltransferase family protein [Actinomycetota bacterium]